MRVVIALGGNALTGPGESVLPEYQIAAVESAATQIAHLVGLGHQVLVSHGNGPQVGNVLAKNELSSYVMPPDSLDWCVAETQGSIGFILLDALEAALAAEAAAHPPGGVAAHRVDGPTPGDSGEGVARRSGEGADRAPGDPAADGPGVIARHPAVVITRTLVDADDPAFAAPTKPIGGYQDAETARRLTGFGQSWAESSDGRWRRVVPSPQPIEIVDAPAIGALLDAGFLVVGGGGGGIPVVRCADGRLRGVVGVVDKDLSSVLLARQVDADALVIATNVDNAWLDWGTDRARALGRIGLSEMTGYQAEGHFAAGSMGPKVQAAVRFVAQGGGMGVITSLGSIADALDGRSGTVVVPD